MAKAHYLGKLGKRKVHAYPVRVRHNDSRQLRTIAQYTIAVVAFTADDAANAVRADVATIPETEITAYGPYGGETSRFVGWYTAIEAQLDLARRTARQDRLPFEF